MSTLEERFLALANLADDSEWLDVLARRRGAAKPHRARKPLVVAVVLVAILAVVGTAVGVSVELLGQQERFHENRTDHPQRRGPLVEVVSGDEWALIAWRSDSGICLDFAIPGNSPFSCGFPVRGAKDPNDATGAGLPTHAVAGFLSGGNLVGGDGKSTVFGVAAADVATVSVELRSGQLVDAALYDAPRALNSEVRFFIVRLWLPPRGLQGEAPVRAFRAYDGDGVLIERFEL